MRSVPETAAEFRSNIRWVVEKRLEIIEEMVCGPPAPWAGTPSMEEAWEQTRRAVGRRDRKAEDEALVDWTRAEVWEWWQGFSELQLLTAPISAGRPMEGGMQI